MELKITKCKIPIVFIDTFAIIDFYKNLNSMNNDKRVKRLYDTLKEKVSQRKIICPIADQEEEINENVSETMKVFLPLSLGIRFSSNFDIRMLQYYQMMCNFKENKNLFEILYSDVFNKDPVVEISKNRKFIVSAVLEPNEEVIHNRIKVKKKNIKELQTFKESDYNLKQYEKQLQEEFKGIYIATRYVIGNVSYKEINNIPLTEKDINEVKYLLDIPLFYWQRVFEDSRGLEDYLEFLQSNWFKNIPHIDINSRLIADIVVSSKRFQSGDTKDLENISGLLPYCNYIVTDKALKNRIKRLGLDDKYKAKVFSMSDIDSFINLVSKL